MDWPGFLELQGGSSGKEPWFGIQESWAQLASSQVSGVCFSFCDKRRWWVRGSLELPLLLTPYESDSLRCLLPLLLQATSCFLVRGGGMELLFGTRPGWEEGDLDDRSLDGR